MLNNGLQKKSTIIVGVLLSVLFGQTALATPGKCVLQVDDRSYINGACDITLQGGGDFMVATPESSQPMFFATVNLNKSEGTATGFWNGINAESHAHDDLGKLKRQGACWTNSRARVCANAETKASKVQRADDFPCGQFIVLHALTSTAQLQCGFASYSQSWMRRAKSCSTELGSDADQALKKGISMFREEVEKQGKTAACSDIANAFPDAIRR